jgi:hypothetical protein
MWNRITRVLGLEGDVFSELEEDQSATGQAALIVVIVSFLAGIGAYLAATRRDEDPVGGVLATVLWVVVSWALWSVITWFIGTKLYKGEATVSEMLRLIGFALAPMGFLLFQWLPLGIGMAITLLVFFWAFAAVYMALKEGLDIGPFATLVTAFVGWLVLLIGFGVISTLLLALKLQ